MSLPPIQGLYPLERFLESGYPELRALARLEAAGLAVAPTKVVGEEEEHRFYGLNNLPPRLNALFKVIDLSDPDEDDIEDIAPEAAALIKTHYLLDEFIDLFYLALESMPDRLRLRRPSERGGLLATRGRPALIALKNLWAAEWCFERLMARLAAEGTVALQAAPVLVQPEACEEAPESAAQEASEALGEKVRLWHAPGFGICQVHFGAG
jgi:hypothetical protein